MHNILEKGKSPTFTMRIENPSLYSIEITIVSEFGASDSLPSGYRPYPGLDMSKIKTFNYTVRWRFEFKRDLSRDSLQEQEYAKWSNDLFVALKKDLEMSDDNP